MDATEYMQGWADGASSENCAEDERHGRLWRVTDHPTSDYARGYRVGIEDYDSALRLEKERQRRAAARGARP